ncbi:MAG: RNA polymerase sigma factor, partial [Dysgonamonadaceae bacterium]|nr:RNA polymerase sigma factor [Dysgonamonadaceae bacterium]
MKKYESDKYNILWKKFVAGEEDSKDAFSSLYNDFANPLFIFGQQFSADEELIKDCVQGVFVRLYADRHKLEPIENVKSYLYISLKNALFNALKIENRFTSRNKDTEYADNALSPEDAYIEEEKLALQEQRVSRTMEQLTPRQREILYYRYVEELSYDDICRLMQMNYQSV